MIKVGVVFNRVLNLDLYVGAMSSNTSFEIPLVAGDTGPRIQLNIRDAQRQVVAVSGMSVNFYLSPALAQSPSSHVNRGHEACSSADYTTGQWIYNLAPGDVSAAGTYFGDVEIIADGITETAYETVRMLVRANFKR